jgi:TetR/AcrR family transcriptional repressor of nem operon
MAGGRAQTLRAPMRDAVIGFLDENEAWVERVLAHGREEGGLAFEGSPREAARLMVSALEGAILVARPYGDVDRFETAAERLLTAFAGAP